MKSDTQRILQVLKMMNISLSAEEKACIKCLLNLTSNKPAAEAVPSAIAKKSTTKKESK